MGNCLRTASGDSDKAAGVSAIKDAASISKTSSVKRTSANASKKTSVQVPPKYSSKYDELVASAANHVKDGNLNAARDDLSTATAYANRSNLTLVYEELAKVYDAMAESSDPSKAKLATARAREYHNLSTAVN